jgi:hypothetical protein
MGGSSGVMRRLRGLGGGNWNLGWCAAGLDFGFGGGGVPFGRFGGRGPKCDRGRTLMIHLTFKGEIAGHLGDGGAGY